MTNSKLEDRCSCGARLKHKCSEESKLGGKICVKDLKEHRQPALPKPDKIHVEDAFNIMVDQNEDVLEELSKK